jgi:hypothetical protein
MTPPDWTREQPLDPPAYRGTDLPPVPPSSPAGPDQAADLTPPPPSRPAGRRPLVIGLSVAIAVALLAGGGTAIYLATRTPAPDPMAQVTAACEEAVKQRLKAPATARFSNVTTAPVGYAYRVNGDVDAENGFSALIRNRFTCVVHHDADGWQAGSVEVGDQVTR